MLQPTGEQVADALSGDTGAPGDFTVTEFRKGDAASDYAHQPGAMLHISNIEVPVGMALRT